MSVSRGTGAGRVALMTLLALGHIGCDESVEPPAGNEPLVREVTRDGENLSGSSTAVASETNTTRGMENEERSGIPARISTAPAVSSASPAVAGEPEEWFLEGEPLISLGNESSGPTSDLFRAKPVHLSDGRIVIGDEGSRLMFFDEDGTYLRTVGRHGQGPGEFQTIWWIQRFAGDSLAVFDSGIGKRVSVFGPDGELGRIVQMVGPPFADPMGVFDDGTLLGARRSMIPPSGVGELVRITFELIRYDPSGRAIQTLGTVHANELIRTPGGMFGPRYLPQTDVEVRGTTVYVATAERFEVQVFDMEDGYLHTFGAPSYHLIPFPAREMVRLHADTRYAMTERTLTNWPDDKTYAATMGIQLDELGNIWLQEFRPDERAAARWWVFEPGGNQIAAVTLPAGFWPSHIEDDFILGVSRDELDIERVQIRRLIKPSAAQ